MPCRPQKATSSKKHLGPCACACMYSSTSATQSIAFHVFFLFDLGIILVFMAPIKVHYRPFSFPRSLLRVWHRSFPIFVMSVVMSGFDVRHSQHCFRFSYSVSFQFYFWFTLETLEHTRKIRNKTWMKLILFMIAYTDRINITINLCQSLKLSFKQLYIKLDCHIQARKYQ